MNCPGCGAANVAEAKFCAECGTALPGPCASCGTVSPANAKFCIGCGAGLGGANEPMLPAEAKVDDRDDIERRQVTILFVDLTDYTRLTGSLGAERTHALVRRFFELVDGLVGDHGGIVERHIGDAIMAIYGVPVAHDNDAERAVRTAFAIHRAMPALGAEFGLSLSIHAGVASGLIVASRPDEEGQDYTTVGNSVNLAARLVALAGASETVISDAVYRSVIRHVAGEAMGEVSVKGVERPVRAWRARELESGAGANDRHGLVGREAELGQFHSAAQSCVQRGRGQVMHLRGEAGMGKTRLAQEFMAIAEASGFACHNGLVLDFGLGRGQDAIGRIVQTVLGASPDAPTPVRAEAADRAVRGGLVEDESLMFLHVLLDVPLTDDVRPTYDAMDSATRAEGRHACLVTLMRRSAERAPICAIVEDVHWADDALLHALAAVAGASVDAPLLLLLTSRPEGDPLNRQWRSVAGSVALSTIELGPLPEDDALALAAGFSGLSGGALAECVARAEGNPLYLEQLLHGAAAGEDEAVPDSIRSIVLSRLDKLSPPLKRTLQVASVLGQRVSPKIVAELTEAGDEHFEELVTLSLLRPAGPEYLFAHALIRDCIYDALLDEQRRDWHRRAAVSFGARDEVLEAEHLERAEDPGAAGAYLAAGESMRDKADFPRAIDLFGRGLAIATAPADEIALLEVRCELMREVGMVAESVSGYRRILEIATDDATRCRAWVGIAAGMRVSDSYEDALDALSNAQQIAEKLVLTFELSQIHYYRGNIFFPMGRIEGCLSEQQLALEHARRAGSVENEARALSGLGDAYYSRGRMAAALDYFERCVALCQANGIRRIEAGNRYMIAWCRLYRNEVEGALEEARRAVTAAVEIGHRRAEVVARLTLGRTLLAAGQDAAAAAMLNEGRALVRDIGANRFLPFYAIFEARIGHAAGEAPATLLDDLEKDLAISRETGLGFLGPWVLSTMALVGSSGEARQAALAEGEELLGGSCVGHSYYGFYIDAMEIALGEGDWDACERYGEALAAFMAEEPLAGPSLWIERAQALSAIGRAGVADEAMKAEVERLLAVAVAANLVPAQPALKAALSGATRLPERSITVT